MVVIVSDRNLEAALACARAGFHVFPCRGVGPEPKRPPDRFQWRMQSTLDAQTIRQWWRRWPEAIPAIDLAKSGHIVIDADRHGADDGVEAFGELMAQHGFNPDSAPLVATPNAGNHHYFRQPPGLQLGNGEGSLPKGINVRGHGGYVIAPGAVMGDGRTYELFGDLAAAPVLPAWLVAIVQARKSVGAQDRGNQQNAPQLHGSMVGAVRNGNQPSSAGDDEIWDLLQYLDPNIGYQDWLAALMAVHEATGGSGTGLDMADSWSARGSKYKGRREIEAKWRSFRRGGVTIRTLAHLAEQAGANLAEISARHNRPAGYDEIEAAEAARRIIEAHDGTIHDAETGEVIPHHAFDIMPPAPKLGEFPPGLVGDIASWIAATARRPQPELALAAALAIVGTVAGRQYAGPTMSGTHLYMIGLAPTTAGKDHPLKQIGRVMSAAKLDIHLGPSEFISMPAVVNYLYRKPLSVCAMDEFGSFMKRINNKRASGFESAISKILRQMWSASFSPYSTPEWAQKESVTIHCPAISLYGTSTPEQFYSSMEGASLEDGTLNRFLLVNGREDVQDEDPAFDPAAVPEIIIRQCRAIYGRSGDLASTWRNDSNTDPSAHGAIVKLGWCPDGSHERYKRFVREVEARMKLEGGAAVFWGRTAEMALRIATIIAIGRLEDEQVRIGDLETGILLAKASAEAMTRGAAEYMAENEHQAAAQRVLRYLRQRGGIVKWRDLLQGLKHSIRTKDLREILTAMADAGQIERLEQQAPTGPVSNSYRAL